MSSYPNSLGSTSIEASVSGQNVLLHRFLTGVQMILLLSVKGELLERENKLISYERAFKMIEDDMYITVIGQAVLESLSFKVGSGNRQTGISLPQKFSEIFENVRLISPKMTSYLTSHNFQVLKIEIFLSHVRYELLTSRSDILVKWLSCYEHFIIISVTMTT